MREIYDKLAFMLAGLVHLLPVAGISGAAKLEALYGVELAHDPVLTLMMQHRALLFGIIGFFLIMAVWAPHRRPAARLIALVSMIGFVVLHVASGVDAPELAKIFWADVVCALLLLGTYRVDTHTKHRTLKAGGIFCCGVLIIGAAVLSWMNWNLGTTCRQMKGLAQDLTTRDYLVSWVDNLTKKPDMANLRGVYFHNPEADAFEQLGFNHSIFDGLIGPLRIDTIPSVALWNDGDEVEPLEYVLFYVGRDFILVNTANASSARIGQKDGGFVKVGGLLFRVTHIDNRVSVYCD